MVLESLLKRRDLSYPWTTHEKNSTISLYYYDMVIEVSFDGKRYSGSIVKNFDYDHPIQGMDCAEDDKMLEWVDSMIDLAEELASYGKCAYCGTYVRLVNGDISYHNYPKPARRICPGVQMPEAISNVS